MRAYHLVVPNLRLRHSARALIVDERQRLLLFRSELPSAGSIDLWVPPGGGLERDENTAGTRPRTARGDRLVVDSEPPYLWHQRVVAPGHATGYDGVINDYFLVRTDAFTPSGMFTATDLLAEKIHDHRWWPLEENARVRGDAIFSPRAVGELLGQLLLHGTPCEPLLLGL